jgi:hypothetical protein
LADCSAIHGALKLVLSIICAVLFASNASAASCRNFAREAQAAIGKPVAALQKIEHEASDRLKGLDSRPFDYLLGEARKLAVIMADPAALKDEEELRRCRNATRLLRKVCADAVQMLVEVLDKHVASPAPDFDKPRYAAAIAECEKAMGLKPLKSVIRGTD